MEEMKTGGIKPRELEEARIAILRIVQADSFASERLTLQHRGMVVKGNLSRLDLFLGDNGLIRVGERLRHDNGQSSLGNPILLPRDNHVTKLITEKEHTLKLDILDVSIPWSYCANYTGSHGVAAC